MAPAAIVPDDAEILRALGEPIAELNMPKLTPFLPVDCKMSDEGVVPFGRTFKFAKVNVTGLVLDSAAT